MGTGTLPTAPDRRQVRINGAAASVNSLAEWLGILWLTPAMDRLFSDSAGSRRRFLDRLTLALEPGHATHAARYEAAMRARNKLLAEPEGADPSWLAALEAGMAEHGAALGAARARTVASLSEAMAGQSGDDFPRAALALDGWAGGGLAAALKASRGRDAAAGRALVGPHRQDLAVTHVVKQQPAARGSTGEQKALLLGLVLAHADLVAARRGQPPILLLDEVAAPRPDRHGRGRDRAAAPSARRSSRALVGPHRQDLAVTHVVKQQPAARGSTGEQKALLLGLVLAHADLVAARRGQPPILLLDEVAAHLDPRRREALFARLSGRGQIWMTATEAELFASIPAGDATRFHVEAGAVIPA